MSRSSPITSRWADLRSWMSTWLIIDDGDTAHPLPDGAAAEEVVFILRQRGGRVRQRTIVAETRWSDDKVSQLLQRMEWDGQVQRMQRGEETLVALPGRLPEPMEVE